MTLKIFSDIDKILPPAKKVREPARSLEGLKGLEFLEALSSFKPQDIQTLDKNRVTFIFNRLEGCIRTSGAGSKALETAFLILMTLNSSFDEQEAFCKSLLKLKGDKRIEEDLIRFSNRLFLSGNKLFNIFNDLPNPSYGKLYEAICSKNDDLVLQLIQEPFNFHETQHDHFVLFDAACEQLSYEGISAFLQKKPYLTSNAFRGIFHNPNLNSVQKLDLIVQLSSRGHDIDMKDNYHKRAIDYAIECKEPSLFIYLLGQSSPLDFNRLLMNAIKAGFTEAVLVLTKLTSISSESIQTALASNRFEIVLILVKASRFKWESDNKTLRVKLPPCEGVSLKEADIIRGENSTNAYRYVREFPAIFSMENFTLLKKEMSNHFVQLTKRVAHAWGLDQLTPIDPLNQKPIESEGSQPLKSLLHWLAFLTRQKDLPFVSDLIDELSQVYHYDSDDRELKKMADRLYQNKLIVCTAGYNTHTTYALFYNDIVFYANRGSDSQIPGGTAYLTHESRVAPIARLAVKTQNLSQDSYFSEKKIIDRLKLQVIETTKHASQSGGFCTLASLKTAVFGIMNLKSIDPKRHNSITAWKEAVVMNKPNYKILTSRYRLYVLKGLLFEIDHMLQHERDKARFAPFYYHLLLSIRQKIETSKRFSAEQKSELVSLSNNYLNDLADAM